MMFPWLAEEMETEKSQPREERAWPARRRRFMALLLLPLLPSGLLLLVLSLFAASSQAMLLMDLSSGPGSWATFIPS